MRLLLHICCAPCGVYPLQRLREYKPTLFFYNPNIHPLEEYEKRLSEVIKISCHYKTPLIIGSYDKDKWFLAVKGLEKEKEGGKRCEVCFSLRLTATANKAIEKGFTRFGTTLAISPHKNSNLIKRLGMEIAERFGLEFLSEDFREGFKEGIAISKELSLYRQRYCGCIYSQR